MAPDDTTYYNGVADSPDRGPASGTDSTVPASTPIDVFATERYAGNQLAVVEDPRSLTDERMGALAAEFDFSETTFVESRESPSRVVLAGFSIRMNLYFVRNELCRGHLYSVSGGFRWETSDVT